jgi:hypothetical protein
MGKGGSVCLQLQLDKNTRFRGACLDISNAGRKDFLNVSP